MIPILILIGVIIADKSDMTSKNEQILKHIEDYGTYDERIFTEECDLEWNVVSDFTPLDDCPLDKDMQEFIYFLCKGYNIDFYLVMGIIKQESNFEENAISSTNDFGLMQINKINYEWLHDTIGIDNLLEPRQNVRAGLFVLRKLFESYTDADMVLMAYNMGETGAKSLWNEGIFSTNYTQNVRKYQSEFERKGDEL